MKLKILILGGTRFTGKILVNMLLKYNYEVTVASRKLCSEKNVTSLVGELPSVLRNINLKKYDFVYDFTSKSIEEVDGVLKYISFDYYIFISTVWVNKVISKDNRFQKFFYLTNKYISYKKKIEDYLLKKYKIRKNFFSIRLPIQVGENDRTARMEFYSQRIVDGRPLIGIEGKGKYLQIVENTDIAYVLSNIPKKISSVSNNFIWDCMPEETFSIGNLLEFLGNGIKPQIIKIPLEKIITLFPEYLYAEPFWSEHYIPRTKYNLFALFKIYPKTIKKWTREKYFRIKDKKYNDLREQELNFLKNYYEL